MDPTDSGVSRAVAPFERAGIHSFQVPVAVPQPVRVFVPWQYPARRPYPLLVLLHGRGENHDDLVHLGQSISQNRYLCLSLRGTEICGSRSDGEVGFSWGREPSAVDMVQDYLLAGLRTMVSTYYVDPRRVFLVGHAQGAALAFRLIARQPHRFAGVVSLGGWLPRNADLLGVRPDDFAHVSVFVGHGLHDRVVPLAGAQRAVGDLEQSGLDVTFRTYPCGHRISGQMLSDVNAWLTARGHGLADG